jgi:hypothetical protein
LLISMPVSNIHNRILLVLLVEDGIQYIFMRILLFEDARMHYNADRQLLIELAQLIQLLQFALFFLEEYLALIVVQVWINQIKLCQFE